MAEEQTPRKKGISWSFILSFLVVAGIISILIYMLFGRSTTKTFTEQEFLNKLANKEVTKVTSVTPKAQTIVVVNFTYTDEGLNYKHSGKISFDWNTYNGSNENGLIFYYFNGTENIAFTYTDASGDEIYCPSISSILHSSEYRVEFPSTTDAYTTSWWDEWGPTIIITGGTILITIFLFAKLSGSIGASNNRALDFNRSRARREKASKIRFADVAGADEEKTEMAELVSYLKEPKKFTKYGAKLPKGVLLVGPPGCGKTLLAKAVAGEAGVPFYSISGSDFVEMFVGVGAGRVRDMFKVAKANAPCLIFIDEIDAVGRQRGAGLGGGNDEREQTLNQLLVEMDGFNDNSGIIVIAATNRDDVLDPALLRAGRFDRKITVSLPDKNGREAIFKVHARNKKLSSDIDFAQLAKRTVGFSGADIENIMNEAAILAIRANKENISIVEIDEAIDRRVAGPAKSSKRMNEHERQIVAYHEAGHAIIGLKYPHSDKVQRITIVPRGNTGGHVRMTPEDDRFLMTKKELEARIVGYLGGRSSEEIFFEDVSSGAQNDIEVATQIARTMVCELGMSELGPIQYERDTGSVFLGRDYTSSQKNFSSDTGLKIDAEVRKIIETAHNEAVKLITNFKDDVTLIANTLLEHEQITAEEIDYLLEHRHLKGDEKIIDPEPINA